MSVKAAQLGPSSAAITCAPVMSMAYTAASDESPAESSIATRARPWDRVSHQGTWSRRRGAAALHKLTHAKHRHTSHVLSPAPSDPFRRLGLDPQLAPQCRIPEAGVGTEKGLAPSRLGLPSPQEPSRKVCCLDGRKVEDYVRRVGADLGQERVVYIAHAGILAHGVARKGARQLPCAVPPYPSKLALRHRDRQQDFPL